jgi:hypothetical protein
MKLIRHIEGQHKDATSSKQIITSYPNIDVRMGDITRTTLGRSWTVNIATMSWTFKSQQAWMFAMMGFEEGTGEPERTMTLSQF